MIRFKRYFLTEGGSLRAGAFQAEAIPADIDREDLNNTIKKMCEMLNKQFAKDYGVELWSNLDKIWKDLSIFSGSSRVLFNPNIPPEQVLATTKKTFGDIDLKIPESLKENMREFLAKHTGMKFGEVGLLASSPRFNLTLWRLPKRFPIETVQIDLNASYWNTDSPDAFSVFSYYSSFKDIKAGVKGTIRTTFLKSFTEIDYLKDVVIITKTGKISKSKSFSPFEKFFDIGRGLKTNYEPVIEKGKHKQTDGKFMWQVVQKTETSMDNIFVYLFGKKPQKSDLRKMHSFIGLLDLAKQYYTDQRAEAHFLKFKDFLIGLGQSIGGLDRRGKIVDKENVDNDIAMKIASFDLWYKNFPFLKRKFEKLILKQADDFKKTAIERLSKRN